MCFTLLEHPDGGVYTQGTSNQAYLLVSAEIKNTQTHTDTHFCRLTVCRCACTYRDHGHMDVQTEPVIAANVGGGGCNGFGIRGMVVIT